MYGSDLRHGNPTLSAQEHDDVERKIGIRATKRHSHWQAWIYIFFYPATAERGSQHCPLPWVNSSVETFLSSLAWENGAA
jgi:hypothetical protein